MQTVLQMMELLKVPQEASAVPLETVCRNRLVSLALYDLSLELSQNCLPTRQNDPCTCVCFFPPSAYQKLNQHSQNNIIIIQTVTEMLSQCLIVNILDEMYWNSMKISRRCGSLPYFHMLWIHLGSLQHPSQNSVVLWSSFATRTIDRYLT